jgi:looped-hinge helix DNA binding domain, AbrB family
MKSTGIVRRIDDLGRIVLPKELRNVLNIAEKDPVEIYVDGNLIILQKYSPSCIFCGSSEDMKAYKGKNVCQKCADELVK